MVLLWSGSACGHFYMIVISQVAFSAQAENYVIHPLLYTFPTAK